MVEIISETINVLLVFSIHWQGLNSGVSLGYVYTSGKGYGPTSASG